jgi:hypothetical protein
LNIYVNEILEEVETGRFYRVLWIDDENKYSYLIDIDDQKAVPFLRSVKDIIEDILQDYLVKNKSHPFLNKNQTLLTEKERQLRDYAWDCIKSIVELEPDIYIPEKRGPLIQGVIDEKGITKRSIYKYLRKYWQRGKSMNALIPDYKNSGGKGKIKNTSDKKRGRPPKYANEASEINVDENIRKIFRVALEKYYLNTKRNNLSHAYKMMIREFFAADYYYEDGVKKVIIPDQSKIPTLRQFRYWYEKDYNIQDTLKARLGTRIFNKDHRAVLGSSTIETFGPGSRFQIDATVADVYLVSRYNPDWIIGRPVVYLVIDVFSRMITGLYVGLEGPSWLGAMMALVNTISDKQLFCREYGIEITKDQWPCEYLPSVLLADRGEFEGYNVERLISAFNLHVENAAPYRPDWKGIVEKMFHTVQMKVKPFLPGYIDKDFRQRGSRDYRLDAKLTIEDFTKLMIKQVLYYNNNHYLQYYLRDTDLIKDDVSPIPIELWNWGIENRSGKLRYYSPDIVKLHLLPREKATVTFQGIKFKNMFYSCEKAIREMWFTYARQKGSWKIDVIYDPRNMSNIYILSEDGTTFETCYLLEHQKRYQNYTLEEIMHLQEYEKQLKKQNEHRHLQSEIDLIDETESIIKKVIKRTKQHQSADISKSERVRGISTHRHNEKEIQRDKESFDFSKGKNEKPAEIIDWNDQEEKQSFNRKSIKELLSGKINDK